MRLSNVLKTSVFRLTTAYVAVFAGCVAALGIATYLVTAGSLHEHLDRRIQKEVTALSQKYREGGLTVLLSAVKADETSHPNGALDYVVLVHGKTLAGRLTQWPSETGWSTIRYRENDGDVGRRRFLVSDLGSGIRLNVAADPEDADQIEQSILNGFLSAFGAVLLLGIGGGIALSIVLLKRVDAIRRTAEAIIAGDLAQRVPVRGTDDDLDRLSSTLNRMLDRITHLMESLKQVSADIAHDLKTPLARLRHRLDAMQARAQAAGQQDGEVETAIAQVDEILGIFDALLRIAQIEAGTRRAGFREVDLSAIFANVVDAFTPAAEDAGKTLDAKIKRGICIAGDRELLTQMLANLVENAIRHTPPGTRIEVALGKDREHIVGIVSDNGPGAPTAERARIFQRFYRLGHSRSTAGSGLGLSLVKAVADLHDIALDVRDAEPGLQIVMRFPVARTEDVLKQTNCHASRAPT